jgi:hypothetical protein
VNRDPLPGPDLSLCDDRAERRAEPASEACCRDKVDRIRDPNEVVVGVSQRDVLREGTPGGETWLELVIADLVVARPALGARSASGHEGDSDAIASLPATDVPADLLDDSGQLVPRHVRQGRDVGIVTEPAMPIAAADPAGPDADHHAVVGRDRIRDVGDCQGTAELFKYHRLHAGTPRCNSPSDSWRANGKRRGRLLSSVQSQDIHRRLAVFAE